MIAIKRCMRERVPIKLVILHLHSIELNVVSVWLLSKYSFDCISLSISDSIHEATHIQWHASMLTQTKGCKRNNWTIVSDSNHKHIQLPHSIMINCIVRRHISFEFIPSLFSRILCQLILCWHLCELLLSHSKQPFVIGSPISLNSTDLSWNAKLHASLSRSFVIAATRLSLNRPSDTLCINEKIKPYDSWLQPLTQKLDRNLRWIFYSVEWTIFCL